MKLQEFDLIIINSSGGKDSLVSIWEICRLADEQSFPKEKIVVSHQDLGAMEWTGTKELVNINSAELTNAPTIGSLSANSDVVYFSSYTYDTELEYQLWRFKNEELKVIANGHQSLWISGNFKDGIIFNTQQSAWYLANNSDTPEPFFDYFQVGYSYGDTKGLYTFPDESAFVFGAKDSVGKVQFWLSDGTLGGTEALFELPGLDFQVYGLASNDIYYGTIFQQPTAPSEIHLRQYSLTKKTNQLIYTQPSSTGFRNFPVVMNNNKAAGVLINRGWVPLEFKNKLNDLKPPTGKTTITGLLRQPPQTNMFTPANNLESGAWYSINFEELSEHKGLNNIWPLMVYDEGAENKTDYPIAQATRPRLKNDHLQYAVFWFSMAGILMIIYGLRFLKRA